MRARSLGIGIGSVLIALALAACGGGGTPTEQYFADLERLTRTTGDEIFEADDLSQASRLLDDYGDRIAALSAPPEQRQAQQDFVRVVRRYAAFAGRQARDGATLAVLADQSQTAVREFVDALCELQRSAADAGRPVDLGCLR